MKRVASPGMNRVGAIELLSGRFESNPVAARIGLLLLACVGVASIASGCGGTTAPPTQSKSTGHASKSDNTPLHSTKSTSTIPAAAKKAPSSSTTAPRPAANDPPQTPKAFLQSPPKTDRAADTDSPTKKPTEDDGDPRVDKRQAPRHDVARLAAAGIRKYEGQYLTLFSDISPDDAATLPKLFDLAIPQWREYFHVPAADHKDFRCTGYLMKNRELFAAVGAIPPDLPAFLNGYQQGYEFWWNEQSSDYYRRHLMLHEGTHAFMSNCAGGFGPPWYSEGMAEWFATHRWHNHVLELRHFPRTKEDVELWGRIKLVKDDYAAGRGLSLESVLAYGPRDHLRNEPYAWSWAAVHFLATHPRYASAFRELQNGAGDTSSRFSQTFLSKMKPNRADLDEDWQLFIVELEYGYDISQASIVRKTAMPLPPNGARISIAANRGWQSTGIRLQAKRNYTLEAKGRFQIASTTRPWPCEPNGVTLQYYRGNPLGILLGAVRDDENPPGGPSPLCKPEVIGLGKVVAPAQSGTLYVKVNDSPAELHDNDGALQLRITESPAP